MNLLDERELLILSLSWCYILDSHYRSQHNFETFHHYGCSADCGLMGFWIILDYVSTILIKVEKMLPSLARLELPKLLYGLSILFLINMFTDLKGPQF